MGTLTPWEDDTDDAQKAGNARRAGALDRVAARLRLRERRCGDSKDR